MPQSLTLFSDEPHPRVWFTFHYRNPSRRNPEPLQRCWGTHPQLNRGLPNLTRSFTTRSLRDTTNHLGYTMQPRGTSSWEHNAPKSNKLLELQSHTRWSTPLLPNPTKATNAREEFERKNKEENHKRTPKPRSTKFPSLRGAIDWWKCGSRSPLTFPSKICKIHWRD